MTDRGILVSDFKALAEELRARAKADRETADIEAEMADQDFDTSPSQQAMYRDDADLAERAAAALDTAADLERRLARYDEVAKHPWSFHRGTLRERLEWCRDQHAYYAAHPPDEGMSREAKADFDRACVTWYAEMLEQLEQLEDKDRSLGALLKVLEEHATYLEQQAMKWDGTTDPATARGASHDWNEGLWIRERLAALARAIPKEGGS